MRLAKRLTVGVLYCSLICSATYGGDDAVSEDLKPMQGTWKLFSCQINGRDMTAEEIANVAHPRHKISGDQWIGIEDGKERSRSTIAVNTKLTPHRFDQQWTQLRGKEISIKKLGIYEFRSEHMVVALGIKGQRPVDFKTSKDCDCTVAIYERAEEVTNPPAASVKK
jgi:uncharacterized protein (TIGR03067 family)